MTAGAPLLEAVIRSTLTTVYDPELPVVSIVDLGMVHEVAVDDDGIEVSILPTFLGCPALRMIQASAVAALEPLGRPVRVTVSHAVPWTSERITSAGRRALAAVGIAPPGPAGSLCCPRCGSRQVVMDNLFGPTQCRSLHYCRSCRQPFEAFKVI